MKLSLTPVQFLALNCVGCGRPISKPERAASNEDITNDMIRATGRTLEELGEERDRCPKCGRSYYRGAAKYLIQVREYAGFNEFNTPGGYRRRGISWGSWRTVDKVTSAPAAEARANEVKRQRGLVEVRVMYKGSRFLWLR